MSTETNLSPAVEAAKEQAGTSESNGVITLPSGVRVKVMPVSAALISDITSRIKDPQVPVVWIAEKERNESNPDDPEYARQLEEANQKRGSAMIDTMVMFGIKLVDGIPADDDWLKMIRFAEKRGLLDLSSYDLSDPLEKEFLFKRYVLGDNNVIALVTKASGLSAEEVDLAEKSFQGS